MLTLYTSGPNTEVGALCIGIIKDSSVELKWNKCTNTEPYEIHGYDIEMKSSTGGVSGPDEQKLQVHYYNNYNV